TPRSSPVVSSIPYARRFGSAQAMPKGRDSLVLSDGNSELGACYWRSIDGSDEVMASRANNLLVAHVSFSHFCMKLFFAAPARALPFLSTALVEQASRLHFRTKLVFAAPVSAFPFLSTALLRQVSCATATLKPSVANTSVIRSFCIGILLSITLPARIPTIAMGRRSGGRHNFGRCGTRIWL